MCGIICYLGPRPARAILLDGLRRLEYRGYDSAGLAVFADGGIECRRAVGKILELEKVVHGDDVPARGGIAHTRWATHGAPTQDNAHPHADPGDRFYIVHNGIVENDRELRAELQRRGHAFRSETDSELLAHLIADAYDGHLEKAVRTALERVDGTFGLGVMSTEAPDELVVARRGSPLILGVGDGEIFAASDVAALVSHTDKVVYLQDDDVAVLRPGGYEIGNLERRHIRRETETVDWDVGAAEKQGFEHFMLKEIHEQPEAVRNAIRGRLVDDEGLAHLGGLDRVRETLEKADRLVIVSCGTSFYAGLLGRYVIEATTDIAVEVDLASEYRYRKLNFRPGTVVLAISQSGETADTLAAVKEAKRKGATILGMVNVVGSSIARETHAGIYNHAGPEIGVASTKAFLSQVTVLYLLALLLGRSQRMSLGEGRAFIRELRAIPEKLGRVLELAPRIEEIAKQYAGYANFLYVGRKFNYPIALEGALKLKEISYLHAEGYAAGEMKHGPIALIDERLPSVCIAPRDDTFEKMVSNIREIRARKGPVVGVGTEGDEALPELCDHWIGVPETDDLFTPLLTTVPLQLFAYYVARERGCEIDQPRNLAKSVTVE